MFDPRFKTLIHVAQLLLVIVVMALAVYRMTSQPPGVRTSIGDRMSLGMVNPSSDMSGRFFFPIGIANLQ